jgi:Putative zinc-finger
MVNDNIVNCEHVWREISNYLEHDVEASLRSRMDEHFQTCSACRSLLEGTRNVMQLYRDERMIEVPSGFGSRLQHRLAQGRRTRSSSWSPWSAWLVPLAALLLISGEVRIASSRTVPQPLLSAHAQPARNIPQEMVVVVSADAKEFHVPGCEFIHNKDRERTLTAKEAVAQGYVPCVRCMRKYLQTASAGRTSLEMEATSQPGIAGPKQDGGE